MKIGAIGTGYQGRKLVEELRNLKQTVVTCDVNGKEDYKDYREMLRAEDFDFDGVAIATSNPSHYNIGKYCLEMGIPVFLEKPMATKWIHATKLLECAQEEEIALQPGSVFSFNNALYEARDLVVSGFFGRIELLQCTWTMRMKPWQETDILLDLMPHVYDICCNLGRRPYRTLVHAIDRSDHQFISTSYRDTLIEIKLSWIEGPKTRQVKIVGDKHFAIIDALRQWMWIRDNEGKLVACKDGTEMVSRGDLVIDYQKNNTIQDELAFFLKQIETGESDYTLAEMAAECLRWLSY